MMFVVLVPALSSMAGSVWSALLQATNANSNANGSNVEQELSLLFIYVSVLTRESRKMRTRFGFGQVPAYITVFQRIRINKYSIFGSYYTNIYYDAIYSTGYQCLKGNDFHGVIIKTKGLLTY